MKKQNILIFFFILLTKFSVGQKQINYGSNNGKFISVFDTKIYYEEYGKGIPLILLEGGFGSIADFSLCIPELSQKFHVIAPDMPGQGRSQLADSMSYQLLANYISKMIDLLKLDSAYIIGWSDGANTALILANDRPDKIKKVLASGANYKLSGLRNYSNDTAEITSIAEIEKTVNSHEFEEKDSEEIKNYLSMGAGRDWRKIFIDVNKMWLQKIYFPASILEGIKIPVMIVLGDQDATTLEHGIEMHNLIKKSQFCVLPNTSHRVFHERPTLINEIAIDFFKN